ncbi:DUF5060 domain-containing protein [Neolewinella lacunae]|nr:DUF5060 domain-containing protein [Neolewinella lacunae]MDN3637139.1 DUF5060 domain-containing protein [Neolewinella lacunae]
MLPLFVLCTWATAALSAQVQIEGERKKWHVITLEQTGPKTSENHQHNPFLHYRMDVTFRHDSVTYVVPGYFAADGDAANTGASAGDRWRVHFVPDRIGRWTYEVSFRRGNNVAVADHPRAGDPMPPFDGKRGSFEVAANDKAPDHFRSRGRLLFHGRKYPVWAETGEYFYKVGTDAPENLLSYADFDGTFHDDGHKDQLVKSWAPHLPDWRPGDPTWKDGKGKALIGAINYLAEKGLNVFSFLTLNIAGDDRNVFPYLRYDDYERMDVSKLAQWEIIFQHGESRGMFLHFKTAEMENQGLLDGGDLGPQRKLYYRELIARFGHHLALNWNMGEENGRWVENHPTPWQTTTQRLAMARFFYENDPYRHHVVIHNGQEFYDLLGPESKYSGLSLQTHHADFRLVYPNIRSWHQLAAEEKVGWAIAIDEPGDAQHSLVPDADVNGKHANAHNLARQNALWGNLLAGGWGAEWYFGYQHDHSDLTCEDFRSRDKFWDQCRYQLAFLADNRPPLPAMLPNNELTSSEQDWVLAQPGKAYLILLKMGEKPANTLKVPAGRYAVSLFNPRTGQYAIRARTQDAVNGAIAVPVPPAEVEMDWVVWVVRQ